MSDLDKPAKLEVALDIHRDTATYMLAYVVFSCISRLAGWQHEPATVEEFCRGMLWYFGAFALGSAMARLLKLWRTGQ